MILKFAAGLRQNFDSNDGSMDEAVDYLRQSIGRLGDAVGSLGDDVNLESSLMLLRSCHETMSSDWSLLSDQKRDGSSKQYVDIELSWGTKVVHNFAESELSIDFLPQSLACLLPKPGSDPAQLSSLVTPGRVAYLMAGIVTKIFRGTDQRSRRDALTSTESFELLQWGFSNETTPPLNLVWTLACCYLRLPMGEHSRAGSEGPVEKPSQQGSDPEEAHDASDQWQQDVKKNYLPPNFFGGEEADASLELLDQCIAILLQHREKSAFTTRNETTPPLSERRLLRFAFSEKSNSRISCIDYPELSLWFGFGHQPSKFEWLPFALAADLCLSMLEDGPRALHYAGNGLKFLYSSLEGCDACIQLLCFYSGVTEDSTGKNICESQSASLSADLLNPNKYKCQVPSSSNYEGHAMNSPFYSIQDDSVVKLLSDQLEYSEPGCGGDVGVLKLYFCAAKAHACWGRNSSLLVPERLRHRKIALKAIALLLRAEDISIDDNKCISIQNSTRSCTSIDPSFSVDKILLEYIVLLAEIGEISDAILLTKSTVTVFSNSCEFNHLLTLLLETASVEAVHKSAHSASLQACSRTIDMARKGGDVWNILNYRLTMVKLRWKYKERERTVYEIDHILNELHRLTVSGVLLEVIDKNTSNAFHFVNKYHSRYWRACFLIEVLCCANRIFLDVRNLERAKACVEDAWRLLFVTREVMSSGGAAGGGGLLWGHSHRVKHQDHVSGLSSSLNINASDSAKISAIAEKSVHILQSHTYWLDHLRSVPTFEGWRLSEACGWGLDSVNRRSCIAKVAVETAEILKTEASMRADALCRSTSSAVKHISSRLKPEIHVNSILLAEERDTLLSCAIEYNSLAISIDPRDVTVLLAAAKVELELSFEDDAVIEYSRLSLSAGQTARNLFSELKYQTLDVGTGLSSKMTTIPIGWHPDNISSGSSRALRALKLASTALEFDDLNFDAW